MRYAAGTRRTAKKSELLGIRKEPSRNAAVIQEIVAITTNTTTRSTFACAIDAHGAGIKKNGRIAVTIIVDQYASDRASFAESICMSCIVSYPEDGEGNCG